MRAHLVPPVLAVLLLTRRPPVTGAIDFTGKGIATLLEPGLSPETNRPAGAQPAVGILKSLVE